MSEFTPVLERLFERNVAENVLSRVDSLFRTKQKKIPMAAEAIVEMMVGSDEIQYKGLDRESQRLVEQLCQAEDPRLVEAGEKIAAAMDTASLASLAGDLRHDHWDTPKVFLKRIENIENELELQQRHKVTQLSPEALKAKQVILLSEKYQFVLDVVRDDPDFVRNDPVVIKIYHDLRRLTYGDVVKKLIQSSDGGMATQTFKRALDVIERTMAEHPDVLPQEFGDLLVYKSQIEELTQAPQFESKLRAFVQEKGRKFLKQYWKHVVGLGLVFGGGSTAAVIQVKDILSDPVKRGSITQPIDEGLREYLGESRGQMIRDWLDDVEEYYSGAEPDDPPASLLHVFNEDPNSAYQTEKAIRRRMDRVQEVIDNRFGRLIAVADAEKPADELDEEDQAVYDHREALLEEDMPELVQIFRDQYDDIYQQNPELAEVILKSLYAYPKLKLSRPEKIETAEGKVSLVENEDLTTSILYDDQSEERELLCNTAARLMQLSRNLVDLQILQGIANEDNEQVLGQIIYLAAHSLLITQQHEETADVGEEVLKLVLESHLDRIFNPNDNFVLGPSDFNDFSMDDYFSSQLGELGLGIVRGGYALEEIPIIMRYNLESADDFSTFREISIHAPDIPSDKVAQYANIVRMFDARYIVDLEAYEADDHSVLEIFDLMRVIQTGLMEQHDTYMYTHYALDMVESIFYEDVTAEVIGDRLPNYKPVSYEDLVEFVIENNLDNFELKSIQSLRINLSIEQQRTVSYQEAYDYAIEQIDYLGMDRVDDLELFLAVSNIFAPGTRGVEKIQLLGTNLFNVGELLFNPGSKNTIPLEDLVVESLVFIEEHGDNFTSRQEAFKFNVATKPVLTEISAEDDTVLHENTEELLMLYGDKFYGIDTRKYKPDLAIYAWDKTISELETGGKLLANMYEFDEVFSDFDIQSFEVGDLTVRIVPLSTEGSFGTSHDDDDVKQSTQLPLVFFEPGSNTVPLSSLFVNQDGRVECMNEFLSEEEMLRNLWVFDETGLSHIPISELGSSIEDISASLSTRPGFKTAFAPSNIIWDSQEQDQSVDNQRKANADIGSNPTYIVSYIDTDGSMQLAAVHTEGTIKMYKPGTSFTISWEGEIEQFEIFREAVEAELGGEIQQIVRSDPEIGAQIAIAGGGGGKILAYSYRVPLPSEFSQSGSKMKLVLSPVVVD